MKLTYLILIIFVSSIWNPLRNKLFELIKKFKNKSEDYYIKKFGIFPRKDKDLFDYSFTFLYQAVDTFGFGLKIGIMIGVLSFVSNSFGFEKAILLGIAIISSRLGGLK